ncbi:hypothetical protein [Cellulosimicrobium sp. CUA-896]|uniref:hypothetical protein n=1 Tax=Cellulosimicrobium sp. CUA-896 TaxID=1517881 RepID=UPI00165123A2|nr:hypothetical protein [Cellulosimicrobium sp. CUA-896]
MSQPRAPSADVLAHGGSGGSYSTYGVVPVRRSVPSGSRPTSSSRRDHVCRPGSTSQVVATTAVSTRNAFRRPSHSSTGSASRE